MVGSGTLRYGFTPYLTAQIHAEGGGGYRQMGGAATAVIGTIGQVSLNHAQSRYQGQQGKQSSAFFSTQRGNWSFNTGWSHTDGTFSNLDVVANPAAFRPENADIRTYSAALGWNHALLGTFNVSYLRSKHGSETDDKVGSLGWNRNIGKRTSLFLNTAQNFNESKQRSVYGGLSVSLDKNYSVTASSQRDTDGSRSHRLALGKSSEGLGSPSWNIGWQREENSRNERRNHLNGYLNYDTQYGDARASVYNTQGSTQWNAGWRGGLALMRGGLFATRNINDSFAVVSTDGVAGVPVSLYNNSVGKTNRKGLLLVPNLSAYQKNIIDIDSVDLPQDMQAEHSRIEAVPSERSGIAVDFPCSGLIQQDTFLREY